MYTKSIQNYDELIKELHFFFEDHDNLKPHYAHKIYTPNEVYNGKNPNISLTNLYANASEKRRNSNKMNNCNVC